MATTYLSCACDASGNFTSLSKSGTGNYDFETSEQQEGSGAFVVWATSGAGTAYAIKSLDTNIANGNRFHITYKLWFAYDWDFVAPHAPEITGETHSLRLKSSAANKYIAFSMQNETGASGRWKWMLSNSISGSDYASGDPGWARGFWYEPHIYGYIHDSAGWYQYWSDGILRAEKTGIDLYPGNVYDQIYLGIQWRVNNSTIVCFIYDDLLVDDAVSPLPPDSGYGSPGRRGIVSPHHNNQRDARGMVNGVWPPGSQEWVH